MSKPNLGNEAPGSPEIPPFRRELGRRVEDLLRRFSSRREAARVAGVTAEQLNHYAAGRAKPPFEVVVRLAAAGGVRLDWLATGQGPMRPEDTPAVLSGAPPEAAPALDEDLLADVIQAVEELARDRGIRPSAEKKARLISALYDDEIARRATDERAPVDQARALRLLRLVG